MYEQVREFNRDLYRKSREYTSTNESPKSVSPIMCKSHKFTGNPFVGKVDGIELAPIMYSSIHGKCGTPLRDSWVVTSLEHLIISSSLTDFSLY